MRSLTCAGPGVNRGMKPDLCDNGGNILYDGGTQCLRRVPESEVFTTYHKYLEGLFTTARGTSCAATLVTDKAAQVLRAFPNASANLIRAFLANSARVPQPSIDKLGDIKIEELMSVCGYGMASADRAATSSENREILFAESEMPMDWFFVYEVPIPLEYAQTKGKGQIAVILRVERAITFLGDTLDWLQMWEDNRQDESNMQIQEQTHNDEQISLRL
jgi:Subtilase family